MKKVKTLGKFVYEYRGVLAIQIVMLFEIIVLSTANAKVTIKLAEDYEAF